MCTDSQTKDLIPSVEEAQAVIDRAKDSGVGPDGLPNSAYKPISLLVACILVKFFNVVLCSCSDTPEDLLLAFMVFLPKKSVT